MDTWTLVIGLIAGTLTTIAFVPQLLKTWRSKSARDVSLLMFAGFSLGVLLWLVYGIMREDIVVILFNAITLVLAGAILFFKIRFDRQG